MTKMGASTDSSEGDLNMSKSLLVNLPVANLEASTRFYEAIGCVRNPQFSDDKASSMVWSDSITIQLLTRVYFSTFSPRPVADAHQTCQVLLALTRDSRADVDAMANAATANGGKADVRGVMDLGWLFNRSFADPDGHVFEAVWMDSRAMPSIEKKT
jgi:predicted lactoylglutathione lyase